MTVSLLELVMQNFEAKLASDGHEVTFACPLCGDHKPRLYLNLRSCLWTCHNCGEAGNLLSFLTKVMEKDPFEAYHLATKLAPEPRMRVREVMATKADAIKLPGMLLDNLDDMLQRGGWNYLHGRGVPNAAIEYYGMRFEVIGPYRGRVIIPIVQNGIPVSFEARASVWWEKPKVLYPKGAETGHCLFGIDDITSDEVILTEGIFDAIGWIWGSCATVPVPRAVATFGAHLAAEQRALLHQKGIKRVTIMWDADPPGRREAAKAARELASDGFEVKVAGLPEGEDPASAAAVTGALADALDSAARATLTSSKHSIRKALEE